MFYSSPFENFMFSLMPVLLVVIAVVVFGTIIVMIIKGIGQWSYNNKQPVLSVAAKVVTKRTNVSSSSHHAGNNLHHTSTDTSYYVTFQVESGDRMEFLVKPQEYSMLVEGDVGILKFQGTRYLGYERRLQEDNEI
ncbi:DUF2500 domain-containing protein [Alkaliphilus crotonatoxidans]